MTHDNGADANTQEPEMLLPWYVTGKISQQDRARVERYLAENPAATAQLDLVREELEGTVTANEAAGSPQAGALDRLMARIDAAEGAPSAAAKAPGFVDMLKAWLAPVNRPVLRFATVGAAVLIVAQAVVIGALLVGSGSPGSFQTAPGPTQVDTRKTPHLLIAFVAEATLGEVSGLLLEIDGTIVGGPKAGGLFEVRLADDAATADRVEKLVAELQKRTKLIRFIGIAN